MDVVFGALDWIALHVFRGHVQWPCWLLDWAWSRQATPHVAEGDQ